MSAGGFLGVNTSAGSGALPAGGSVARLVEWHLLLSSQRDVAAAATSLQHSGFEVNRSGDDRLARDPWGTHVRLRRDC